MKTLTRTSAIASSMLACLLLTPSPVNAQNYQLGQTKLAVVGNAQVDFIADSTQAQFRNLAFKPIFLVSLSDKLFLESELEVATDGGEVELVLEYANMVYFLDRHVILHAGRFLPKFGAYRGRFGEAYLQRFAKNPVGFGDGGIGSMIETGIGAQGGAQVGDSKINYDLYLTNGPQLLTGSPDEAGQFEYEAYGNNNKGQSVGGRFGFLPLSNSSLEIGYSIQHKSNTGDRGSAFENTSFSAQAFDLNYYTALRPLKSQVRVVGEYKMQNVGTQSYALDDSTTFSFDNKSTAYYIQGSIRPSESSNPVLQNLEVAFRYAEYSTPKEAYWFADGKHLRNQMAASLNYWFRWNGVLKMSYVVDTEIAGFYGQLVYGF